MVELKELYQLTLLLRLRKLDNEIIKKLEDMPITYDIEKDILYQRGIVKGKIEESKLQKAKKEAKTDENIIELYKEGVAVKILANGLKVSQYRVRKVIKEWKAKSDKN